jgi:hypothetical protein
MFGLATQLFINEEDEKAKTIFETIVFNRADNQKEVISYFDSYSEHEIIYTDTQRHDMKHKM